jgi:hypothetical protein
MRDASAAIPGQVWALESPIILLDTCTGEEVMPVVFIQDYIADEDIGNNKEVFYAFMVLPQSAEPVLETPLEKWQHYPFVESYDLGDVPCDPAVGCVSILHPVYVRRDWCKVLLADFGVTATYTFWKKVMDWAMSQSPALKDDAQENEVGGYSLTELSEMLKDCYRLEAGDAV